MIILSRTGTVNKGRYYREGIKPFNFMYIGFSNYEEVKPIAPYSESSQTMPYSEFINYKDAKIMDGEQYFESLADELYTCINHSEAKLEGDSGILKRRHILMDKIAYIGKEANNIGQIYKWTRMSGQ